MAHDIASTAHSRATADRVLRVIRRRTTSQLVASMADVQTESLLLELRDLTASRGDEATGPVATLLAYDERHDAHLLETLEAWLDSFGDVASAAAATFVHPNTLRYRLRRLAEVSGLDLADPEQRFAAMLELRMLTRR